MTREIICDVFTEVAPSDVLAWFQKRADSDLALVDEDCSNGQVRLRLYAESSEFMSPDGEGDYETLDVLLIDNAFPWPAVIYDQLMIGETYDERVGTVVFYLSLTEHIELNSVNYCPLITAECVSMAGHNDNARFNLDQIVTMQETFAGLYGTPSFYMGLQ